MRNVIKWFVDNPVAANLMMMVFIVGGLISLSNLRQEEFPEVDLEIVTVTVPYLGATPEEVEEGVCIRIEEALEGTERVFKMSSSASASRWRVPLSPGPSSTACIAAAAPISPVWPPTSDSVTESVRPRAARSDPPPARARTRARRAPPRAVGRRAG